MTEVAAAGTDLDEFEALLGESFGDDVSIEGSVVKGTIISLEGDTALIDVGLKSEGRVPLREFTSPGQEHGLKPGDLVEVYVERMEDVWDATKLFVFPSRFEGYGMAAVEPMMHGTPVIVQDYPSIREAVGDAAIIMPYGQDSREWLETIEELFFDDEEYREFKEKGYKRIQQLEDREDEQMKQFITFMENIL